MFSQAVTAQVQNLRSATSNSNNLYKPLIIKLSNENDRATFQEIIESSKNLQVFDTIDTQIAELVKCLRPTIGSLPPGELDRAVAEKLGGTSEMEYGVWVYYPWSNKLVHLLDEEEFTIVRTNRNKYKITHEEQITLATKKIGVMGLSVGQSVSLTLAMERGFGELRIADFDELDLSNINRIRTGVHNIKLKKTVIVAREIAEIDPFLNVVCFDQGITNENIHDFLTGNGKLDLLIDECDSFDIKINSRKIAKSLGIPVLMEGSDRGTIDIERFDLEPEREILHGMVSHLDMNKFKDLKTFDEKVPYITAVTGLETLSPRMKASAVELMSTISTWPQLASAVTFGGGVSADLSRKILLNNLKISGRFFLDLDELICDQPIAKEVKSENVPSSLTLSEIQGFIIENNLNPANDTLTTIDEKTLEKLIEAAKLAPSGGNNQPWRWHYENGQLHLFLEQSEALAYLDPQFISSYTSLGAAIENLLLAASAEGLKVNWLLTPNLAPKHIAVFTFENGHQATDEELKLSQQIPLRHTNRKSPKREILDEETKRYLLDKVATVEGAKLTLVEDIDKLKSLAEIAVTTDLLRMFIPEAHEDFITREMRWTEKDANDTGNGIGIHTLDLNNNDQVGIRLLKDRRMIDFLQEINGGGAFSKLLTQQFLSSSCVGLITMPTNSVENWIKGGIASEKMWLAATSLGLQIHPVNVPLIFFYKNTIDKSLTLNEEKIFELFHSEKELNLIFDKSENLTSVFMFRIFRASASTERTIRKSTDKIFSIGRV
jgi:nitroreductase/molybdopterin/thiamine biosynthesis adenylyltransferase